MTGQERQRIARKVQVCKVCREQISIGTAILPYIEFGVRQNGYRHLVCPIQTYEHERRGGHIERVWEHGGTFQTSEEDQAKGEPDYMTVIMILPVRRDYASGPDNAGRNFIHTARCRAATAEEIANFKAGQQNP